MKEVKFMNIKITQKNIRTIGFRTLNLSLLTKCRTIWY